MRYSGGCARNTWPASMSGRMYRNSTVSSSVVMCWPSTSASAMSTILWYRSLEMSNSSPMLVPNAVIIDWISALPRALSRRARSTFRILPRSGRMACVSGLRPCLAEPPAESPSTMYTSQRSGSFEEQSASLPGMPKDSSGDLRRALSRALRAARRACEAMMALRMISLAGPGLRSNQSPRWSVTALDTNPRASELPSLVLVWPSNCGSESFTEITAVRPSRMSSPVRLSSLGLRISFSRA